MLGSGSIGLGNWICELELLRFRMYMDVACRDCYTGLGSGEVRLSKSSRRGTEKLVSMVNLPNRALLLLECK